MRKLVMALSLSLLVTTTGCFDTSNQYGECQGLLTQDEKDSKLEYKVSKWNVFMGVVFSETLLIPGLVAALWVWCPAGKVNK